MTLDDDLKKKIIACAETVRNSRKRPDRIFDPVSFIYGHGGNIGIFPYVKPADDYSYDEFCYILKEGSSFTVFIDDRVDEKKQNIIRGLYAYCIAHMIGNMKYFRDKEAFMKLPDGKYAPKDDVENTRALALSVCLLMGKDEFDRKLKEYTKKNKTDYSAIAKYFNVTEYTVHLREEMITED